MSTPRLVPCVSLTAWFRLPEQGMQHFEVLSRASACFVQRGQRGDAAAPTLLSSRHVTHPNHFAATYYKDKPFLEFVHDAAVRCTLEVYLPGAALPAVTWPLSAAVPHPRRDLSALSVVEPEAFRAALHAANVCVEEYALAPSPPPQHQPLTFHGHWAASASGGGATDGTAAAADTSAPLPPPHLDAVDSDDEVEDGVEPGALVPPEAFPHPHHTPRSVPGYVVARSQAQVFGHTEEVLEMGMCGGPVVCDATGQLVGVVEGVVPPDAPGLSPASQKLIEDTAVFVEVGDVAPFVGTLPWH